MAISYQTPVPGPHDYSEGIKIIVLTHLTRSQTLESLTHNINLGGYVHFSEGFTHNILRWLDKDFLVTVRRKNNEDRWYITKQGVNWLKEQGMIR
jgi:hypothetical protein